MCRGAISGDLELFASGIGLAEESCVWCRAFRALAKHAAPIGAPAHLRTRFAQIWLSDGDHLRCEAGNDLVLIAGLRLLLPPYVGPAMRLYRGDSAWNRRRRTYGLRWTADIDVARGFANGVWRTYEGGSVLLTTMATPADIISVPAAASDSRFKDEEEYLLDRRALRVTVLERFSRNHSDSSTRSAAGSRQPSSDISIRRSGTSSRRSKKARSARSERS